MTPHPIHQRSGFDYALESAYIIASHRVLFRKRDNKSVSVVSHETDSPVWVALCVRELRLMLKFARERTFGRHGPDFHLHAVRQARAFPRDSHRFVEAGDVEQKIAANRFLGFRKWAVRHHAVFARYDFAFGFERVSGDGFALIGQPS